MGADRTFNNVAYHLMRAILARHDFDGVETLIAFCKEPENLRPWLPTETDRIIYSDGLVEGLHEIASA